MCAEAARKGKGSDDEEEEDVRAKEEQKRNKAAGGSRWGVAPTKVSNLLLNYLCVKEQKRNKAAGGTWQQQR